MNPQFLTATGESFAQRLSATRRGARLARRLAAQQLHDWGIPHGSDLSDRATQIVAELAANAVTHGRVPGRDFELRLTRPTPDTLRIEVTDARGDRTPGIHPPAPTADAESGRGLLLVELLSTAWGVAPRQVGKTVWAELRQQVPGTDFP